MTPYLGLLVHFWDALMPSLDGERIPRVAIVTGLCESPKLVHLTVLNNPEFDVRFQGMGQVRCGTRVPFVSSAADKPAGLYTVCSPMFTPAVAPRSSPDLCEAGNPSIAGKIAPAAAPERVLEPIGDNGDLAGQQPAPAASVRRSRSKR